MLMLEELFKEIDKDAEPKYLLLQHGCDAYISRRVTELKYVVISCEMDDPVYAFWCLEKEEVLADTCHIVFTHSRDCKSLDDLTKAYGGVRFGDLVLMVYKSNARPGVMPSQKGLHMT